MRISQLAGRTGIPAKTIRYYEATGLLPAPEREASSYRRYGEDDVDRLTFLAKAKTLGLSLAEIGDILQASSGDSVNCEHVLQLLTSKRDQIDAWIREAKVVRDTLDRTIAYSSGRLQAERSTGEFHCPIIERGLHERALQAVEVPTALPPVPTALLPRAAPAQPENAQPDTARTDTALSETALSAADAESEAAHA